MQPKFEKVTVSGCLGCWWFNFKVWWYVFRGYTVANARMIDKELTIDLYRVNKDK